MKKTFSVVVAGAGMIGLTIACLISSGRARRRLKVTILDAGERPGIDAEQDVGLRVSAIAAGSAAVFESIGAWDAIEGTRACPYRDMRVWDADGSVNGPESLRFEAAEFALPDLGCIVENELIQHTLLQSLEASGQSVRFGTSIAGLIRQGGEYLISLEDGDTVPADLVIAADGASSFVRRSVNIAVRSWRYPQCAFVTHLEPEIPHRHTAWQRFLRTGPVALLPLCDGRVSTVWSTTPEQAQAALDSDDETLGGMLSDATDHVLGELRVAGPRGMFPLRAQHAERYVLPGLALIGDAAHSIHPLAGQGANLGVADAAMLSTVIAEALDAAEFPGDLPVLRRYERARKGANKTMLHFVDAINRLFSSELSSVSRLRSSGMRLFNRSGPIRRQAVQVALGLHTGR